jgi:hypothetical protein
MKSKKLRWLLSILLLVVLSPVLLAEGYSLYTYLRYAWTPSATEQLLDFAALPRDTELPRKASQVAGAFSGDALNTDYSHVESILAQRFPVGTSRQEIERFSAKHSCGVGAEMISCSFAGVWYPPTSPQFFSPMGFFASCSDAVYLNFSFDPSGKLDGIESFGATNCV